MLYSAYFGERAEHYRELARRTPNGRQAEYQWGLANLFLEMSCDMRLRELTVEPNSAAKPKALEKSMRRLFRPTAEGAFDICVEHLR
jgi:hypothetical protein